MFLARNFKNTAQTGRQSARPKASATWFPISHVISALMHEIWGVLVNSGSLLISSSLAMNASTPDILSRKLFLQQSWVRTNDGCPPAEHGI
jgi:hypothetical protein